MRLLIVNPNISTNVTELIEAEAQHRRGIVTWLPQALGY